MRTSAVYWSIPEAEEMSHERARRWDGGVIVLTGAIWDRQPDRSHWNAYLDPKYCHDNWEGVYRTGAAK